LSEANAIAEDTDCPDETSRARLETIAIIVNSRSGSLVGSDPTEAIESLRKSCRIKLAGVFEAADDFDAACDAAMSSGADVIAIAGGDGTARSVLAKLTELGCEAALLPLPLGTANILPHRLYGDRSAEEILSEVGTYEHHRIDAGRFNGELFLVAAAVGFPAVLGRAREAVRPGSRRDALRAALSRARLAIKQMFIPRIRFKIRSGTGAPRFRASGAFIAINDSLAGFGGIEAPDTERAVLQCIAFRLKTMWDMFGLGMDAMTQGLSRSRRAKVMEGRSIVMTSRRALAVMLDGEPAFAHHHARIRVAPEAVLVLKPPQ
jgi:diacylglycerol kinase family enzyme|tara:strand:+ start:1021 stop:1980 length:960 start_codon:yes stop_codon:yes gene_type:complete